MRTHAARVHLAVLALLVSAALTSSAGAHALLDRADPAPGGVLPADRPPSRLVLQFTEPVTVGPNAIVVLDGHQRRVGPVTARVAGSTRVEIETPPLAPGAYAVHWRVTSADSHIVRGTYWFAVGWAPAPPPLVSLLGTGAPTVPWLEVLVRWLTLVATLGLAGIALFDVIVLRPMRLRAAPSGDAAASTDAAAWRVPIALTAGLIVAELGRAAVQAAASVELPLSQALDAATLRAILFEDRFAALWWMRVVLGIVLGALLAIRWTVNALVPAALLLVGTAAAGHAVSGRAPVAIALVADVAHLAAGALWLGGLAHVGFGLARGDAKHPSTPLAALVPRLSAAALVSVLVLAVTGAVNTYAQVGSVAALGRTAYGQSLVVKLALLVPWLALAAVNRFVLRPRVAAGDAGRSALLTTLVRGELGVGVVTLLVVGLLGSLPPPGAKAMPAPADVARQAGPLRVALHVDPHWVGVSRFRVTLANAQGQPPPDVRRVVLTFTMEGMNMGRTHVTLAPRGDGTWETEGFYVGMPGISQVGVAIARDGVSDTNAVFRMEVPDTNAAQFAGLLTVLGWRRSTPIVADAAGVARGREVYERQCAVCHGETGTGNGWAAASLVPPPADLTLHARWHADEQLFWLISHGITGTSMVGFADRLSPGDRRDTIGYLRALAAALTATAPRAAPVATAAPLPASSPPTPRPAPPSAPAASSPTPAEPSRAPAATRAEASTPSSGPTGRLVFGPDFDNNLWLMTLPDGQTSALTRFGPLEFSSHPVWSPDGKRIAFSSYRLPGGDAIPVPDGTDLYVMSASGGAVKPLAAHDMRGAALRYPAWSADGTAVYASSVGPGGAALGIDRIDVATGVRVRVVPDAEFPTLSRDGRRLAYVRFAPPPVREQSVWWSAPNGSGGQQIVAPNTFDKLFGMRFAPDGKRLLFAAVGQPVGPWSRRLDPLRLLGRAVGAASAFANGDLWDLWTVDVDGRNLRPLTSLSEDLPIGVWSPDGAFVAFLGGGSARTAEAGITVLGADGTPWRRLTTQPGHRGLDWARP